MKRISPATRRLVIRRSGGRCEYCRLDQAGQEATFHVDHVIPVVAGGQSVAENLALACVSCSLRKGARLKAVDPRTGSEVFLFSPRRDIWSHHFEWHDLHVVGLTPTGRATVDCLDLNRPLVVAIRKEEAALGRHPG